jgi:hypothetical protein
MYAGGPQDIITTSGSDNEHDQHTAHCERVHIQDRRTLLVTNLSDRTTHKDLAAVVRGGRLLEIYIRNDRSATISFVEGAAEFLAYVKRNDIYLHTKRVSSLVEDCPELTPASLSSVGIHVNSMSQLTSYTRSAVEPLEISSYAALPAGLLQTRFRNSLVTSIILSWLTSPSLMEMLSYPPTPFTMRSLPGPA